MITKIEISNLVVTLVVTHNGDSVPHRFRGEYEGKRCDETIIPLPPSERKTGYQAGDVVKLLCSGVYHLFTIFTAVPVGGGSK